MTQVTGGLAISSKLHDNGIGDLHVGNIRRGPVIYEIKVFKERQIRFGEASIDGAFALPFETLELPHFELVLADGEVVKAMFRRLTELHQSLWQQNERRGMFRRYSRKSAPEIAAGTMLLNRIADSAPPPTSVLSSTRV